MLVVFYSHTGNTRTIARHIQALTGCDLLDLEPVTPYPRDYDTVVSQAKKGKAAGLPAAAEKSAGYGQPL